MKQINKNFLTGFISLLPVIATLYVVIFIYRFISGVVRLVIPVQSIAEAYVSANKNNIPVLIETAITIISIILILGIVFFIGFGINTFISKRTLRFFEGIILRVPLANSVYGSVKQVTNLFFSKNSSSYKKTVLIEYPRKGLYSFALVTKEGNKNVEKVINDGEMINVFVPTAPNPTSGFYMIVRKEDTVEVDITVEETFKSIISGGTISPKSKKGE